MSCVVRWWDVLFVKGMHFSSKNACLLNWQTLGLCQCPISQLDICLTRMSVLIPNLLAKLDRRQSNFYNAITSKVWTKQRSSSRGDDNNIVWKNDGYSVQTKGASKAF